MDEIEQRISKGGETLELLQEFKAKKGDSRRVPFPQYQPEVEPLADFPRELHHLQGLRMKLLRFHENHRPTYYGTWSKKSLVVKGRKPFVKDEALDYEFDSDDEWEDEPEGEDIGNSGDERDEGVDEELSDDV